MTALGERLKLAREERGFTQAALAKGVGTRQGTINDLEVGRTKSSSYIMKIANFLDIDPQWLVEGVGDIRGAGVQIMSQGAPLPLFDMKQLLSIAKDDHEELIIAKLYRCPVKHSERAYTTILNGKRENLPDGAVLFVDPVSKYNNGDLVVTVFPDSEMSDIRVLVSNGVSSYLKSIDSDIDPSLRLTEFKFDCLDGGEIVTPMSAPKNAPEAKIIGRVIFIGIAV
ncbi:hypothetical protein ACH42_17280 [Endozoicomonas sp. (ex Bugula neritina AB1)]|nr:hypothetical protein ACH42_17280 [Endozoicomonas sp. (ex Bugula neritina AB1)]